MKTNWNILTHPDKYQEILDYLKLKKVNVISSLDFIFIVTVECSTKKMNSLRKLEGIISIEKDGLVEHQKPG